MCKCMSVCALFDTRAHLVTVLNFLKHTLEENPQVQIRAVHPHTVGKRKRQILPNRLFRNGMRNKKSNFNKTRAMRKHNVSRF